MRTNTLEKVEGSNGMANNGVAYDRENKLLFMAQTYDRNIKVYQLDGKGNIAKFVKNIPTVMDWIIYILII